MGEEIFPPDEQVLRLHLESGRFRSGVALGRWRLVSVKWPLVFIVINARDGANFGFSFQCEDYPRKAVTARPWDLEADGPLPANRWPKGRGRVALAFNMNWKYGTCLYLPCDRLSFEGHGNWHHEHPALLWEPDKGLCKYLGIIHELLNSNDYEGSHAT
jgi:hypothetical protein